MDRPTVVFVVGTRPDAIKSAPVVLEFLRFADQFRTVLVATGQHREMLDQALATFGLQADFDLQVMRHGQSLAGLTGRILEGLDPILESGAAAVIAQGDTTTTFVAGLAAFYRQIPFVHIEAGLRTDTVWNPFPEEFNRRAVGLFARLHLAPTQWAAQNLRAEGKDEATIAVTGNTGIDAVMEVARRNPVAWYEDWGGRIVLLTTHRRENWGEPQRDIAMAGRDLLSAYEDVRLVVPMHRNPQVRETLTEVLGHHERCDLIDPPDYPEFVKLLQRSDLILTDSGGIQEEAPAFGKPLLVLRETTERPEGVQAGTARLVGTDRARIVTESRRLLDDGAAYAAMAQAASPYGDGRAASRVRYRVGRLLGAATPEVAMWTS